MPSVNRTSHRPHPAAAESGAGIVEYVLLILGVALVVLTAMGILGERLGGTFSVIGAQVAEAGEATGDDPDAPAPTLPDPAAADWDRDTIYTEGDTVSHDGRTYEALWWTRGERPGTSSTGAWQEMASTPDGTPVWTSSRIFDAGDVVVHDGVTYRAKWWTRDQRPLGTPHGPWERLD